MDTICHSSHTRTAQLRGTIAQALATLRSLAVALKLCKPCTQALTIEDDEEKDTEAVRLAPSDNGAQDLAEAIKSKPSTIAYVQSTLTDVSFEGSVVQDVRVVDCNWNGVTFIDCNLAGVTFFKTEFRNVTFSNVDFHNVRLLELRQTDTFWQSMQIKQLLISKEHIRYRGLSLWVEIGNLRYLKASVTPLEASTTPRPGPVRPLSTFNKVLSVKLTTKGSSGLLGLPRSILDKIMAALYHQRLVDMRDGPPIIPGQSKVPDQTTYPTLNGSRTTYRAKMLGRSIPDKPGFYEYITQFSIPTGFVRVSKACFELAVPHMYNRFFRFPDGPEACLAFLHDHRRQAYQIAKLQVSYRAKTEAALRATNLTSWRRLFNVLVHEREDLKVLKLVIDEGFWDVAPWKQGVKAVFDKWEWPRKYYSSSSSDDSTDDFSEIADTRVNFLQHVARLSTRVDFELSRQGDDVRDVEKRAFRKDLEIRLKREMRARPYLAKAKYGICKERRLERCCYYQPR